MVLLTCICIRDDAEVFHVKIHWDNLVPDCRICLEPISVKHGRNRIAEVIISDGIEETPCDSYATLRVINMHA